MLLNLGLQVFLTFLLEAWGFIHATFYKQSLLPNTVFVFLVLPVASIMVIHLYLHLEGALPWCLVLWSLFVKKVNSYTCKSVALSHRNLPDYMLPSFAHFHELLLQTFQPCWCPCQDRGNLCLVVLNILYLNNLWICVVVL